MKQIKIQGKRAQVEMSGRGYVTVRVPDLDVLERASMEEETKARLSEDKAGWRAEMARLESEAIKAARAAAKEALKQG